MQLIFFPSLMGKRMYSFYIWGVRRCAEKENLEWGKQVGNNRENETEIDLLQLAKALWHKAWAACDAYHGRYGICGHKALHHTALYGERHDVCEQQFHFRRKHAGEPE